jgi:hypothetical protein
MYRLAWVAAFDISGTPSALYVYASCTFRKLGSSRSASSAAICS